MALYLGNQKVSLRSGQDPTFDYGFDSNGRLVFANKNATEINNFLNYDSTYSEILDLSNLNKMEKVAVNGTSDRKMEGLKGLLVSPNAPFTGSSPQINASYTGLSKRALVSLFESVPYNVGYTKVGNPTIVDGVVSGITDKLDFITVDTHSVSDTDVAEIFLVLRNIKTNPAGVFNISDFPHARVTLNYDEGIFLASKQNTIMTFISRAEIDWVNAKILYINIQRSPMKDSVYSYTLKASLDGTNWVSKTVTDETNLFGSIIRFGCTAGSYGQGYKVNYNLDLNETYIKVNGVPWFTGAATRQLDPAATNVGGVTITNGVVSGFSTSKYISTATVPAVSSQDTFGFNIRFKTGTNLPGSLLIAYQNSLTRFGYYSTFKPIIRLEKANNTYEQLTVDYSMSQNTWYLYKAVYDGTNLSAFLYADDGTLLGSVSVATELSIRSGYFRLGTVSSAAFDGSIDLNNTCIIANGTKAFSGMVPMTKTCSIVGAIGTADLTQEDKNIILNKGWSLTVQ